MIRRPPRSTLDRSSAASDVYKRQGEAFEMSQLAEVLDDFDVLVVCTASTQPIVDVELSLIHISVPTRPY